MTTLLRWNDIIRGQVFVHRPSRTKWRADECIGTFWWMLPHGRHGIRTAMLQAEFERGTWVNLWKLPTKKKPPAP